MRLIVTADDFGGSPEINQAIIKAHRDGILTSASLMVAGPAADEAVALALATPTLAVGLHIVLVDGLAVLSPNQLPSLVNSQHQIPDAPLRLGLRYAISRAARKELHREVRAQFERFARTGLKLSHVDAHQHMHMHPAVFPLLIQLAVEYQAAGIRLPRDDLRLALSYDSRAVLQKLAWAATLGAMSRYWARRLTPKLHTPVRCYGLFQSGRMTEQYVMRLLHFIDGPSAEIYFHPTLGERQSRLGPNQADFASLLSAQVREAVAARGFLLSTYRDLCL